MRLLYTLRYGAVAGNCGGDLRLFFTTQNSSDWKPGPPPPGMWILPANTPDTLTLASGDVITFALYPVNNGLPAELFLFGAISVKTKGGQVLGNVPIGQATVLMAPGKPEVTIWKGRTQGTAGGVTWDIGFEMAVPWDGTSADCNGQWWAVWH
jgi:hypothetical protein